MGREQNPNYFSDQRGTFLPGEIWLFVMLKHGVMQSNMEQQYWDIDSDWIDDCKTSSSSSSSYIFLYSHQTRGSDCASMFAGLK